MARVLIDDSTIKKLINMVQEDIEPMGLLLKLCYGNNFRIADVRFALAGHFEKSDGIPKFYIFDDKTGTREFFPIPHSTYEEIHNYIIKNQIQPNEYVFEITKKHPGVYYKHKGVMSHEWIEYKWQQKCKQLGIYTRRTIYIRNCKNCDFNQGHNKCAVFGMDHIRNRNTIKIKYCKNKKERYEHHPQLHETMRGAGARKKILYYMKEKGMKLAEAKETVFNMSNWKSRKVFNMYMDHIMEKDQGVKDFMQDFADMKI